MVAERCALRQRQVKAGIDEGVLVLVERGNETAAFPRLTVERETIRATPTADRELQILLLGRRCHVVRAFGRDVDGNPMERVGATVILVGGLGDDSYDAVIVVCLTVAVVRDTLQKLVGFRDDVYGWGVVLSTPTLAEDHKGLP
ncbi:MAG TPA: hypothetical protein VJ841_01365 [Candidatus Saccharimonadales bacterium]|nr:hypothetical protein [Candidatus Saccharimonadales bacterium]